MENKILKIVIVLFTTITTICFLAYCNNKEKQNADVLLENITQDYYEELNCIQGTTIAENNILKNNIFLYGFADDTINNEIFSNILETNYNIGYEVIPQNKNEVSEGYFCYNKIMNDFIEKKYGENFINKIKEKSNGTLIEAEIINDSISSINDFIITKFNKNLIHKNINNNKIFISYKIDYLGIMNDLEIKNYQNDSIKNELKRIFFIIDWQPATLNDVPISKKYLLSIRLHL